MDKAKLALIISTLEKISVSGKENMSRLLGCIAELENMLRAEDGKGEKK